MVWCRQHGLSLGDNENRSSSSTSMSLAAAWLYAHSRTQRSCNPARSASSVVVSGTPADFIAS